MLQQFPMLANAECSTILMDLPWEGQELSYARTLELPLVVKQVALWLVLVEFALAHEEAPVLQLLELVTLAPGTPRQPRLIWSKVLKCILLQNEMLSKKQLQKSKWRTSALLEHTPIKNWNINWQKIKKSSFPFSVKITSKWLLKKKLSRDISCWIYLVV